MQKSTDIDVVQRSIAVVRSSKKRERDADSTVCEWLFDLSDFSDNEIWELATRSLVIDAQRLWRADKISENQTLGRDELKPARATRGPSKKNAMDFLAAMSPEERAQWLEDNGLS